MSDIVACTVVLLYTSHNGNLPATLWARWWGSKIPILNYAAVEDTRVQLAFSMCVGEHGYPLQFCIIRPDSIYVLSLHDNICYTWVYL